MLPTNRLFFYAAYKYVIPLCCLQKWYSYMLATNRLFLYSCGKITKIACSSYKAKGGITWSQENAKAAKWQILQK